MRWACRGAMSYRPPRELVMCRALNILNSTIEIHWTHPFFGGQYVFEPEKDLSILQQADKWWQMMTTVQNICWLSSNSPSLGANIPCPHWDDSIPSSWCAPTASPACAGWTLKCPSPFWRSTTKQLSFGYRWSHRFLKVPFRMATNWP